MNDNLKSECYIAKYWKQPKCPSTNEWIKKLWYIYTMEFYEWTTVKGLTVGGAVGGGGQRGKYWDNCNRITIKM